MGKKKDLKIQWGKKRDMIQFLSFNSKNAAPLFTSHIGEGCIADITASISSQNKQKCFQV